MMPQTTPPPVGLCVQDLTVRYGTAAVLQGVSFSVPVPGQLIGLLGVGAAWAQEVEVVDQGEIALNESVEGEFEVGVRDAYRLEVEEDGELNIFLDGESGDMDTYLRVYFEGDDVLVAGRKAIMGALTLYLDFINLFTFLLQFMGNRN